VPVLAPGTPSGARLWIGLVWQFLNPDFLFLSGDSSLINSTREAGLFPIAFAILVPIGIWAAWRASTPPMRVVLIGLVTAPAASLLSGAIEMNRIMFVIPFAVLVAAIGGGALLERGRASRLIAVTLFASVVLQFTSFHRDYLQHYPSRAGRWFGGNMREAVIEAAKGQGPVYLSAAIPMADRYWAFYAPADRAYERNPIREAPAAATPGARAMCAVGDTACASLQNADGWRQVASVRELSGEESFLIFERR
jgi:GNAT superfamily N-acetyltransferase